MKRLFTIGSTLLLATVIFGILRAKEQSAGEITVRFMRQQSEFQQRTEQQQADQKDLWQKIAQQNRVASASSAGSSFSPELAAWLLAGNFSDIPVSLVNELRNRLNLAEDTSSDFVLVSKPTMQTLRPPSPGRNDNLPDALCALLAIEPNQRTAIQSALTESRRAFADWAKENVQREGPQGDMLVRYVLPAANDFADAITNRLLTNISDLIGPERADLFRTYAETWFQIETGYLGGVTNTLSVLRRSGSDGNPALFYHLTREGLNSSMGEGPGEIDVQYFPPAWRNVFPGGWPEVAQREGLDLPAAPKGK